MIIEGLPKLLATFAVYVFLDVVMCYQAWRFEKEDPTDDYVNYKDYWLRVHGLRRPKPKSNKPEICLY